MLFFKCLVALFNPVYRREEGIKWRLVSCIVAMFLFGTVFVAVGIDIQSISFIDNREFLDIEGVLLGPIGYQSWSRPKAPILILTLTSLLNSWVANGLLVGPLFSVFSCLDV